MDKIRRIWQKYREIALYAIFGALTTLVNWLSYMALTRLLGAGVTAASAVAWVAAVVFAYITNRKWVFDSRVSGISGILRESAKFASGRVFTGVMDIILMNLAVGAGIDDALAKIAINVLVIILNYVISKLFVFRGKGGGD